MAGYSATKITVKWLVVAEINDHRSLTSEYATRLFYTPNGDAPVRPNSETSVSSGQRRPIRNNKKVSKDG